MKLAILLRGWLGFEDAGAVKNGRPQRALDCEAMPRGIESHTHPSFGHFPASGWMDQRPTTAPDYPNAFMSHKRRRAVEAAAAAPPPPPPAPPLAYFRYTPAPEDGPTEAESKGGFNRQVRRKGRGDYHEVDKVDIPAPAEWLCHDAAASTKLRA